MNNNQADNLVASEPAIGFQWSQICEILSRDGGEAACRSWIMPLKVANFVKGRVTLAAPTRFMRDWVETHYLNKIIEHWRILNTDVHDIVVIEQLEERIANVSSQPAMDDFLERDDEISAILDSRFTFENFVVGKPNELAYAAALRVAESPTVQFNPLFLYGGVGLGKTHLMHSIAWHIKKHQPHRRVIYLSAEKFMYQFVRALRFKDTVAFKEQFRTVNVLMIDDVQFIIGKETTQEEFFHTFNALVDQNHQVIISADKSPSDLEGMEERLKSRLGWGLVADIHPTTYELRLGILQAKAEAMPVMIPQGVIEFLAVKITSNIRELEGALNRIVAHATLVGRPINLETTQEVLRDLLKSNDRRLTIDEIQKRVAEFYRIKLSDMQSAGRSQALVRPRQVAMYLTKQYTTRSLPEIGRKFGGRDHTTVLYAVRKIEELRGTDREFAQDLDVLCRTMES